MNNHLLYVQGPELDPSSLQALKYWAIHFVGALSGVNYQAPKHPTKSVTAGMWEVEGESSSPLLSGFQNLPPAAPHMQTYS